ncbi:MAG: putative glycosyltransferase, partial [Gammaproteobacteria bacterium]
ELLYSGRRAVFLPRTFPRREQVIRAERLAALGLGTCLEDPKAEVLSAAITKELAHNRREGGLRTWVAPMTGAANLTAIAEELVDGVAAQAKTPTQRVNELDRKAQRLAAFLGAIE